jgi:hypothetical protein
VSFLLSFREWSHAAVSGSNSFVSYIILLFLIRLIGGNQLIVANLYWETGGGEMWIICKAKGGYVGYNLIIAERIGIIYYHQLNSNGTASSVITVKPTSANKQRYKCECCSILTVPHLR